MTNRSVEVMPTRASIHPKKGTAASKKEGRGAPRFLVSNRQIDPETGVMLTVSEVERVRLPQPDDYVKMFVKDVGQLLGFGAGEARLLIALAAAMDYENRIILAPGPRRELAVRAGFASVAAMNNALLSLVKLKVVARVGHPRDGVIEVDPHLFAKGEWQDIVKRRQAFSALFEVVYESTADGPKRSLRVARTGRADPNQPGLPGIAS